MTHAKIDANKYRVFDDRVIARIKTCLAYTAA